MIAFELNGQPVSARDGESILEAAQRHGINIPHLCFKAGMRADGNCRACMVEIAGERALAPSCCRNPAAGMAVSSTSARAIGSQKLVIELLLAETGGGERGELTDWARALGVSGTRFAMRERVAPDASHPAMQVELNACIQCGRCVRACREEQVNDVIGWAARGHDVKISFDLDDPMGNSSCVACGECVQACPTGALLPKASAGDSTNAVVIGHTTASPDVVRTVCPYCGVGCQVNLHVDRARNRIVQVDGADGPANHGRLCVKGRFGYDYVHHPHRLTRPLIRRADTPKHADASLTFDRIHEVFREASWDEALDLAARRLLAIRDTFGRRALAGFGSAKGSNEEAYLFQKLVRTGFGSNNVDHCTRLCHASSVAALREGIGSAAVSNPVADVQHADVIFLIGSNPTVNHPVAATWIKNAVQRGAKLIVADPRRTELARHAHTVLQFRPDTDVALLNAMLHTIVHEELVAEGFVADRVLGFEALRQKVAGYSPEAMAPICGIPAHTIREVARLYATSRASMILWGMGVSQHIHGTDNARCLIALAMIAGQIGRPGTGLHPLRGQNNVQGASDAGLIPMVFPDYANVNDPAARAKFETAWGVALDGTPGLTVVEIMHAAKRREIRGMYIVGENPAMSDPDLAHARDALATLDWLVVQDIFFTETAWHADVILPATAWYEKVGTVTNTDRLVQLGHKAIDPPGDAREDLWTIQQIAARFGLNWHYAGEHAGVAEVFDEMRHVMPSIAGITWERLQRDGAVTYPCEAEDDPGESVIFASTFPTPSGKSKLVPADVIPGAEQPDADYPFVLITGRQLEHWHTGAMTRRASMLDALEPAPTVYMHPLDYEAVGAHGKVTIRSRRGQITLRVRVDEGTTRGAVFVPFAYYEAAANLLTNPALDPFGKIPEFKYCAVAVAAELV